MSQYTESAMGSSRGRIREGKEKKYQVRVEVRCSNQEILNILRTDIENLIVRDLSLGHFIMSWFTFIQYLFIQFKIYFNYVLYLNLN